MTAAELLGLVTLIPLLIYGTYLIFKDRYSLDGTLNLFLAAIAMVADIIIIIIIVIELVEWLDTIIIY